MREDITERVLKNPLIGRNKEIEKVTDAIEEGLLENTPVIIVLKGAPQSGKSRFLDEIEFREGIVKNLPTIRTHENSVYEEVIKEVISLAGDSPPEPIPLITNELANAVLGVVKEHPLIFLIDDLDKADKRFRDFVEFIANLDFEGRFILAVSYTQDVELSDVIENKKLPNKKVVIELKPFDRSKTREFVRIYSNNRLSTGIADKIYSYTGGSPGLIVEMLKIIEKHGWEAVKNSPRIWSTVKSILDAFHEKEIDVLLAAAIYGDKFKLEELSSILPFTSDFIAHVLDKAARWGVIVKQEPYYKFEARLYKKILVVTADKERIKELHRLIAESIEKETHDPELLAYHYYEGEMFSEAARYYTTVGDLYLRDMKLSRAQAALRKAVIAAQRAGDLHAEFDARFTMVEVYRYLGEYEDWKRQIASLYRIATRLDSEKHRSLADLAYANYLLATGQYDKSLKFARKHIKNPDIGLRERAMETAISALMEMRQHDEAEKVAKLLFEFGEEIGDDLIKARARFFLARIYHEKREFMKSAKLFEEVINTFSQYDLWRDIVFSIIELASIYIQTRKLAPAYDFVSRALELATSLDNDVILGHCKILYATFLTEVGQYGEAMRLAREGLKLLEGASSLELYISGLILTTRINILKGEPEKALKTLKEVNEVGYELNDPISTLIDYKHYFGIALWQIGRKKEAESVLLESYRIAVEQGYPDQATYVAQDMALFYVGIGEIEKGKQMAFKALKAAKELRLPTSRAYYALFLAAKMENNEESAKSYIEKAYASLVFQAIGLDERNKELFDSFFENVELNRKIRREWMKYNMEGNISPIL